MELEALTALLHRLHGRSGHSPLEPGERELLEEAVREYPYFLSPRLQLALRESPDAPGAGDNRLRTAMAGFGHEEFVSAAEDGRWDNFYPASLPRATVSTDEAIDTFLNTFGHTSPEEEALLNKLIFNPTPDYAEMLAREEQENLPEEPAEADADSQEARINSFILSRHPAAHREEEAEDAAAEAGAEIAAAGVQAAPSEAHDDSLLSESLAKIFIKQGRYERAYEIISGLNLKFPEKSVYFADQLRFLQKLIINQRAKARKH